VFCFYCQNISSLNEIVLTTSIGDQNLSFFLKRTYPKKRKSSYLRTKSDKYKVIRKLIKGAFTFTGLNLPSPLSWQNILYKGSLIWL